MMPLPLRAAWSSAALLSLGLVAACSGNDVLAPPDGTACTVGSVAPGDSVNGVIRGTSCQVFDPDNYVVTFADAWTLNTHAGTAYLVRVHHRPDTAAVDHWNGAVYAFGRNSHGDASLVAGWYDTFGTANPNNGYDVEMMLTADVDRTLSIRVTSTSFADTGAYSLAVTACPMTPIGDTLAHTGVTVGTDCEAQSFDAQPVELKFFSMPSDSIIPDTVFATQTGGTGTLFTYLSGTGMDLDCWNSDCDSYYGGFGANPTLSIAPSLPGRIHFVAGVRRDSTVTLSFTAHATPPAVPPAPSFTTAGFVRHHHGGR